LLCSQITQILTDVDTGYNINYLIVKELAISELESILRQTYQHFNDRDIDATLAMMHPEVDWPNGMEGGIEHGHEAVKNYWTRQWKVLNPVVEPIGFDKEKDGRINVTVRQIVHDVEGKLLVDQIIHHIYTFEEGLIKAMEIKKTE
jgi:hypothetical protein